MVDPTLPIVKSQIQLNPYGVANGFALRTVSTIR